MLARRHLINASQCAGSGMPCGWGMFREHAPGATLKEGGSALWGADHHSCKENDMDAREYLARKGLDGRRDEERPNTLEEKAWERAREAGAHQPRAGTPYDWEEWTRYHEELTEGADAIQQKIVAEAHRRAARDEHRTVTVMDAAQVAPARQRQPACEAMTPPEKRQESPAMVLALKALAVLMPPLAVGLTEGGRRRVTVSCLLTLLGWVPGILHAWAWLRSRGAT